jgi:hypothetical protein
MFISLFFYESGTCSSKCLEKYINMRNRPLHGIYDPCSNPEGEIPPEHHQILESMSLYHFDLGNNFINCYRKCFSIKMVNLYVPITKILVGKQMILEAPRCKILAFPKTHMRLPRTISSICLLRILYFVRYLKSTDMDLENFLPKRQDLCTISRVFFFIEWVQFSLQWRFNPLCTKMCLENSNSQLFCAVFVCIRDSISEYFPFSLKFSKSHKAFPETLG